MSVYANSELRSDMQVMAAQLSRVSRLTAPSSDEDLRRDILRRAQQHEINLTPNQITVRRTGPSLEEQGIYLAADYRRPIHLLGLTFTLHFTPEARSKGGLTGNVRRPRSVYGAITKHSRVSLSSLDNPKDFYFVFAHMLIGCSALKLSISESRSAQEF